MARRKIKTFVWTRTNHPDFSATIYRDSDTREYVVVYYEGRAKIGDSFHDDLDDAVGTANAELKRMGALFARKRMTPATSEASTYHRRKNAIGDSEDQASMRAMEKHLLAIDSSTLFADGAYGKMPTLADWEAGKDFVALDPPTWKGGRYFSIRDTATIHGLGYRKIVFGGAEGFDVDLVMQ